MKNHIQNLSLQFVPIGTDNSYELIDHVIAEIKKSELNYRVTAFSTQVEGTFEQLTLLIQNVEQKSRELAIPEYLINFQLHAKTNEDVFLEDKTKKH